MRKTDGNKSPIMRIKNKSKEKTLMKKSLFLSAEEKEECVVRYKSGESIQALAKEFNVTERSIYRWCKKYDGTTESLRNRMPISSTPHPNKMPEWEEQLLIEIVKSNPNITNLELAKKLGTGRNQASLQRKREKIFGKRSI